MRYVVRPATYEKDCPDCGKRALFRKGRHFCIGCDERRTWMWREANARPICRCCGVRINHFRPQCAACGEGWYQAQRAAGQAVNRAVKSGQLPRPDTLRCVDCGTQAYCYDHRDYHKKLDVQPVCASCNQRRGPAAPLRVFGPVRPGEVIPIGRALKVIDEYADPLERYIRAQHGRCARLAKQLNVSRQRVYQMATNGMKLSAATCATIERATDGAVTRRDLRPDDWARIWPELADKAAA